MFLSDWDAAVALAHELDAECDNGHIDPARAARLARAVLALHESLRSAPPEPPDDAPSPDDAPPSPRTRSTP